MSVAFCIALFLVIDFIFGGYLVLSKEYCEERSPYIHGEDGFYELKSSFSGIECAGHLRVRVSTDARGFRIEPGSVQAGLHDIVVLGDSFVYGFTGQWDQTFAGMLAIARGGGVLNAGIVSYSPTGYLYRYEKALHAGLMADEHTVIVGVDISDVQDEAGHWVDGIEHPVARGPSGHRGPDDGGGGLKEWIKATLPLTNSIYQALKAALSGEPQSLGIEDATGLPRSGFTYADWAELDSKPALPLSEGYAPLGVYGGLERISSKLHEIVERARDHGGKVYFVIWPWPDQIVFERVFDWPGFIRGICESAACAGVVDLVEVFDRLAQENETWYEDYYVVGDIHFNEAGNRIIFEQIAAELQ